jgi:AcrR family transcriptional regulator
VETGSLSKGKANQRARRERILAEARQLIVAEGLGGLSLRVLANRADVAVRTVYSLVGRKEDVLIALYADLQAEFVSRLHDRAGLSPLELVEAVAEQAVEMFCEDEAYHRAAYIAIEHLDEAQVRPAATANLFEIGEALLVEGFQACKEAGLLMGGISADQLARLAMRAYRTIWRQWACGQISLQDLRSEALAGAHIVLLSDASPSARAVLMTRLAHVS